MQKIKIHLPIIPPNTTHQSKHIVRRGGFASLADDAKLNVVKNDYMSLLAPHAPKVTMTGAIKMQIEFVFPWNKTARKRDKALGKIPKLTKPDADNMAKTIADIMTKLLYWKDDCQIYDNHQTKYFGNDDIVGITINIEEL
ncbi:MAG: RusA family crossover junction endodeoxyribonuclease [Tannerellaceae bacterium]